MGINVLALLRNVYKYMVRFLLSCRDRIVFIRKRENIAF
jgi:hypothetical protein